MNQSSAELHFPSYLISFSFASLALVGLLSCSTAPYATDSSTSDSRTQETASSGEDTTSQEDESGESQYQSRLDKAEKDLSSAERTKRKKADTRYDKARTLLDKGEYERALDETKKALDQDPQHEKAQQLKDTLLSLMGDRRSPSANLDNIQQRLDAKLEQNLVQIETGLADAKQMLENEEYSRARKKLQTLKTRLKGAEWMDSDKFDQYRNEVDSLLSKATVQARKQKESIQQKLRDQSRQQAVEAEKKERMQEIRWTDRMMSQAVLHFKQEDYEQTINITNEILSRFPNFQVAKDLKRDAQKARAGEFERELRAQKAEQWKNFQERMMSKRVPQSELLKFPSEEYWKKVNQRSTQQEPISAIEEQDDQQPLFSLRKKLKSESTSLEFASSDLENVLDAIREKHDLNIIVDGDAENKANQERSVFLKDLRLTNALSLITKKYGLRYDLREDTVFVTTPANKRPQTELQTFKTRDLVYLLKDVKDFDSNNDDPKRIDQSGGDTLDDLQMSFSDQKSGSSSSSHPYQRDSVSSQKEDPDGETDQEKDVDLAGMVKKHVAPDSWDHENTGIRQSYNGMLFVQNTPEVLANVERFVDDLRSFAGSMVNVSVHFLSVRDEFLEHFGIEFKQADGQSTIAGQNQSGGQAGGGGQSGTTSPPGPGVDYNFLSNFTTSSSQPSSPLSTIENAGGLGLTYQNLSGTDYQAVLRALQRDDRSYILDSSQFTLFNTQRAHISAGQQKAFIQDFEVQPSAGSSSFNPQIGVIGTGLLLDVRPIISFDRRYVTLQLLPSLTSDVTFDNFQILNIGGVPLVVQLPRLQKKSVSTTVRLPDNGSLLLGGLTRSETLNKTQGTPVLKDVPILGALFKESVRRDVGREIRILVKVEILNTAEEQQEAYGSTSTTGLQSEN